MPAKQFLLPQSVQKHTRKLPKHIQKRLPTAFIMLKQNPLMGEKLHGDLKGYFKYRLGNYRIVYVFHTKNSIVKVVTIEHRQGVYK